MYRIAYEDYLDKVRGGWFGKCLGGASGAPLEGFKRINKVKDFRDIINPQLPNDDLDLQLLWLEVLQKNGLDITSRDLADAWNKSCWYPFMEYGIFLKNYERGIYPPSSGEFNNPLFREGNGCPIRSEIWGFIFPGNPVLAVKYAGMDGSLDHCGSSVWIEQFFAAMESMAFFEDDIIKLIDAGMKYMPKDSKTYRCAGEVLDCFKRNADDWLQARTQAIRLFGHHDFSNSTINMAFVLIGLLYGKGSLEDTINITLRCGYDSDRTCATAAAILGTVMGYKRIDQEIKKLIDDKFVVGIDVKRENNSIGLLSSETCEIGLEAARFINKECSITEVVEGVIIRRRNADASKLVINIEYRDRPSIGYDDWCGYDIVIANNTKADFYGTLEFHGIPPGWKLLVDRVKIYIPKYETITIRNEVFTTEDVKEIHNTNIFKAALYDSVGETAAETAFGIAGASVWKLAGPYLEAFVKEDVPGTPPPHGEGCILPTLECMVNNAAYLERQYIDEKHISESIIKEDLVVINAYEDMLPVDEVFTYSGQGCVYMLQKVVSPADREVWSVIGNNDGFRLWVNNELVYERDEIRLWTPYNNAVLVKLKKGINTIVLKLLRRTESLKFSFALRKYDGRHWHKNRWYVDFITKV